MVNLPKSINTLKKSSRGFTLIELLVVIAIIAILAVIGISIYSGVQRSARDSKRRAEIDSLAKSIEVTRNPVNGYYQYRVGAGLQFESDYPSAQNRPADPSGPQIYCIGFASPPGGTTPPADPAYAGWTGRCPSGYNDFIDSTGMITEISANTHRSWKICAKLEANPSVFCKSSLSN